MRQSRSDQSLSKKSPLCGKSGAGGKAAPACPLGRPLKLHVSTKNIFGNSCNSPKIWTIASASQPMTRAFSRSRRSKMPKSRVEMRQKTGNHGLARPSPRGGCGGNRARAIRLIRTPHSSSSNSSRSGDPASTSHFPWWFGGLTIFLAHNNNPAPHPAAELPPLAAIPGRQMGARLRAPRRRCAQRSARDRDLRNCSKTRPDASVTARRPWPRSRRDCW